MNTILNENDTAFYVFDICKLKERVNYLRSMLPESVSLCYAVKANTFIIEPLIGDIDRFEICSPGEATICKELGVPDEQMVISGVYKTPSVIEALVSSSQKEHIYTVESISQFCLLHKLSVEYNRTLRVLLRLTNDSQFGINESEIIDIISRRDEYPTIDFIGIQYFSGTQKTSLKKLKREVCHLDELLIKLETEYGYKAKELEYGPGFPVSYFESDSIDEEELLTGFADLINNMQTKLPVALELGRSIAASCGSYYTHIVDIKRNKEQNYALIDGGMHHIVYYGQHMAMKIPFFKVVGKENNEATDVWNICGSLCSMNDIVTKQAPLPDIEIGDVICFENTGAYCAIEGISLFLSRELPAVYLHYGDEKYECVRRSFETSNFNLPKRERK